MRPIRTVPNSMEMDADPIEEMGDSHRMTSFENPMHKDAFALSDEEKIARISEHFAAIMDTLGLDLTDDSLKGTPNRVAKMYVQEVFSGLNPANKPEVRLFTNNYEYSGMVLEKDITVHSFCEHHFVPIIGRAHVAYLNSGRVVGLSKLNRIVGYFARRPQVQERLTMQIAHELMNALSTPDVAVVIDARHMCVSLRGVEDENGSTITSSYHGAFAEAPLQQEFLHYVFGSPLQTPK